MNKPVLIREFVILFNYSVTQHSKTGEPIPEMSKDNISKVDNCLKTPFSTFDGVDLYPTAYDKAAILFYVFVKNHPLTNGNKRMAYLTMAYFLNKNKIKLKLSNETVYVFTKNVAMSDPKDKDSVIEYIKQTIKPKKMNRGGKLVGASHANGGIDIITPNGQIEAEGGEIIITKKASEEHCEVLSKINQSGGGVAIPCGDSKEHKIAENGTKIDGDEFKYDPQPEKINSKYQIGDRLFIVNPSENEEYYQALENDEDVNSVLVTGEYDVIGLNWRGGYRSKFDYILIGPNGHKHTVSDIFIEKTEYMKDENHSVYKLTGGKKQPTMENNQLKAGIEIEKEHMDTYNELKSRIEAEGGKMPMGPEEFFKLIAQDHLNEKPDYYNLIKTYVEPETMALGGFVPEGLSHNAMSYLRTIGRIYPDSDSYDTTRKSDKKLAVEELLKRNVLTKGNYDKSSGHQEIFLKQAYAPFDKTYVLAPWLKAGEYYDVERLDLKGNPEGRKDKHVLLKYVDRAGIGSEGTELGLHFEMEHSSFFIPYSKLDHYLLNNWIVQSSAPTSAPKEEVKEEEPAPIVVPKDINTAQVTNWNLVPKAWKNTKTINEVKYINSPYDKPLINIVKPFLGTDTLRVIMAGINFDANGITATDAHKLITLPYPNPKYKGVYSTGSQIKTYFKDDAPKNDMFSGKYPNYAAIIPAHNDKGVSRYEFSVYKLLQYTLVAQEYCNKVTWQVTFKFGDKVIGFNTKFLVETLQTLLKLGHETAYAFVREPNNPMVICPDAEYEVGKNEILLLMPVMNTDYKDDKPFLGSADLDWNRSLTVYFDFTDNNIHNADGTVAEFKMNYGEYDVLGPNLIKLLNTYSKKGSKSLVVILENFIVKDNKIFASDMDTDIEIQNPNSQMTEGVYKIINGAVEFDAFSHLDDYAMPLKAEKQDYKFIISAGVLRYYIDKIYDYTGNDDLRPVMSGFNIEHKAGKTVMFATNAHVLAKVDLTPYVEVNKDQIDFSIIVSKNNLLEFLDYVGEDALIFKADSKITTIESSGAKFNSRNIDGRYPAAEQVIPRGNYKKLTLNIKDLYNCLKSDDAVKFIKEHKKDSPTIYDKLSETPGVLDIYLAHYEYERGEQILKKEIKICSVPYSYETNDSKYLQSGSLLLIMPVMRSEPAHFAFAEKLFHQVLDTCSTEEISFEFSEPNRAYIVPGESFDFSQTISAKKQPKSPPQPPTQEQEWKNTINSLKSQGTPEAAEAIETLEILLTEKFEEGGVIMSADDQKENDDAIFESQFGKH